MTGLGAYFAVGMLWKIGSAIAILVAVVLVTAALHPPGFAVERSRVIPAPSDVVFPFVNDFHQWVRWSPWEGLDPNMKRVYAGADAGPGAVYEWEGNGKVGSGRSTIDETIINKQVKLKLEMFKPFACSNRVTFLLAAADGGTLVTWRMEGESPFVARIFTLFMNMDRMCGRIFEQGLSQLDAAVKSDAVSTS